MVCGALVWFPRQNAQSPQTHTFSAIELSQILEKSSNGKIIQVEVDDLFARFGERFKGLYESDLASLPALAKYAQALDDEFHNEAITINENGTSGLGVPWHVSLRFGSHLGAQMILIFRTGADLSSLGPSYEKISDNIYLLKDEPPSKR